jgi:hypothetical protein
VYRPKAPARIDDLDASAAAILKNLPGVERVEATVAVEQPRLRIIHVCDWHQVARDLYALDVQQAEVAADGPQSGSVSLP